MDKIKNKRTRLSNFLLKCVLILLAAVCAIPLYITVVNVFKATDKIAASPMTIPIPPTLENLKNAFTNPNIKVGQMYMNSILITVFGAILCIIVSSMAAYYLARVKSRLSKYLYVYFLFGLMVPYVIVYVPLVTMFNKLAIPTNLVTLIFVFVSGSISFSVFMFTGFIGTIAPELEEAAIMDNAGQFTIYFQIIMPLVKPCTATVAIFIGLSMWNDFLTPLLIGQIKTITVGIYTAIGPHASDWGSVFAYVLLATLPIAILYICAQKQFISGLTSGALKG